MGNRTPWQKGQGYLKINFKHEEKSSKWIALNLFDQVFQTFLKAVVQKHNNVNAIRLTNSMLSKYFRLKPQELQLEIKSNAFTIL